MKGQTFNTLLLLINVLLARSESDYLITSYGSKCKLDVENYKWQRKKKNATVAQHTFPFIFNQEK